MTSPDLIRADYPTLDGVASTFDEERDRVQRVRESVARHLERLKKGGWVSDAADSFYREMDNDLLPSLERLKTALGAAGETTRRIVQIMRQAEQEAAAAMRGTDDATANGESVTSEQTTLFPVANPAYTHDDKPEYQRMFIQYNENNADIIGNETTIEATITDARSAVVEAAESGDEVAYAAALAAYESAIENSFGMYIESDEGLEPTLEALDEYRAAAEADAAWFEQLWCGEDADCYGEVNRYALYHAASGNRVIRRVDVTNLPPGPNPYYRAATRDDGTEVYGLARGYTSGTTYYDIFGGPTQVTIGPPPNRTRTESGERTVENFMLAENGSHEEGHSFLFTSGLGNLFLSPLRRLLGEDVMSEAFGMVPGGLTPAWSEIGRDTRQNPQTDFSELQADTFLFTSRGQYDEFAQFTPAYQSALRQAVLSNLSPTDYYQAVYGEEPVLVGSTGEGNSINAQVIPGSAQTTTQEGAAAYLPGPNQTRIYQPTIGFGTNATYTIPPNTEFTVFGRSEMEFASTWGVDSYDSTANFWVYGGWQDSAGISQYGWVNSQYLSDSLTANLSDLPAIPFADVDPARTFSTVDPYNAPNSSFTTQETADV